MKQYIVLDLFYTTEEGQEVFEGSLDECQEFITEQGGANFMYKIIEKIN